MKAMMISAVTLAFAAPALATQAAEMAADPTVVGAQQPPAPVGAENAVPVQA